MSSSCSSIFSSVFHLRSPIRPVPLLAVSVLRVLRVLRGCSTLLLICLLLPACGSKDDASASAGADPGPEPAETSSAERIIETGGFFPSPPGIFRKWGNGSLFALGDVDHDGVTDFVAASGTYPGSFALFSGAKGAEIWRVTGKTSSKVGTDEKPYVLSDIALAGDQNADGIPDIFAREDWNKKSFLIFSGANGILIARADAQQAQWPIRVYDFTRDGTPDLLFHWPRGISFQVFAGGTFTVAAAPEQVLGDPAGMRQDLIVPDYADVNGDGLNDLLAAVRARESYELAVISAADFSVIQRRPWPEDIARTQAIFACPGDVNADGTPDLIISAKQGAGESGDSSWLAALSGVDFSRIWQINGEDLPGGPKRIRVDVKTKERRELPGDVGFGDQIILIHDLDADGVKDIAIATYALEDGKSVPAVRVFSAATGRVLALITLPTRKAVLVGAQIEYLESIDKKNTPGLALDVRIPGKEGVCGVAVIELPSP